MVRTRELGKREKPRGSRVLSEPNAPGALTSAEQVNLVNRFLPNRWSVIEKSELRLRYCQYLPGDRLVIASEGQRLRFYLRKHRNRYQLINDYTAREVLDGYFALTFNSGGNQLAYAGLSDNVYCCRIDELGTELQWKTIIGPSSPGHHIMPYFALRYTIDDKYLIAARDDGSLNIFGIEEPIQYKFRAHRFGALAVHCFKTTPHIFCSGGADKLCKIWDIRSPGSGPIGFFAGHRNSIGHIDGVSDDRYIVTNALDKEMKIWDLRRLSKISTVDTKRREQARNTEDDVSVMTWRLSSCFVFYDMPIKFSPVRTGQRYIYSGNWDGNVHIFDILTGKIARVLAGNGSAINDCCWHPDDSEIIGVSSDGVTARWCDIERFEN